ncbi:N-ethylmaleimide reductase [Rhodoblastus acidophilus]|uniref:N-ethylmaleimide reductase n=1 Tax=Rhodoblastus acidophilus TaxID=1074 RepID=A0A6N8DI92_RHOAC|nr:alkene reductase [Rhodoblastus acidophilus]MCW2273288.1 N-ethylmaleimide reductase [Rhodoblastus acidophilus]MTV30180.1 N-ethylmaleimide reductase [Rhodoblastus acidophilus]
MTDAKLFQPFQLGALTLKNRVVMAPLTRNRATPGNAANALIAEQYRQRAGAGLLITEASPISQQGQGYINTPWIATDEQVAGWRLVTDAVHQAGGAIFVQLWHVGRVSHVSLQPDGGAPVAPSTLRANTKTFLGSGFVDVSEPRALATEELQGVVNDYVKAAKNATRAGFDGVEIHAANGYLLDQFQRDSSNKRTDAYGGSIENRARLTLEVIDAMLAALPPEKIGIRFSPVSPANDVADSNPQALFGYLVEQVGKRKLAYVHIVEGATGGPRDYAPFDYAALRKSFGGAYIANNGYDRDMALNAVETGAADLVAFGRPFISNPDLVDRLRTGAALAELDKSTLYGGDAHGYTDYPRLGQ